MMPAASLCGMTRGKGMDDPSQPRRFLVSPGLTPERVTRTRASPVPGSGAALSPTSRTSAAAPWRSYQAPSTTHLLHRTYPRKLEADVYEALHTRCIR